MIVDDLPTDGSPVSPRGLEQHHPIPQSTLRQVRAGLPKNFPVGWTVPVHRDCHKAHYADGFKVASSLLEVLRTDDLSYRDEWARVWHQAGVYLLPLIVNGDTRLRFSERLDPDQRWLLVVRQMSSASGLRGSIRPVSLEELSSVPAQNKTHVFNNLANCSANRGATRAAVQFLKVAEDSRSSVRARERDVVALSSANRRAQVHRGRANGLAAMSEARRVVGDGDYSYLTALLLCGWNSLSEGRVDAGDNFDEILAHLDGAPWLYVAEGLFGKALHSQRYRRCSIELAYQWLCQAQYIYVWLGLQGMPHLELSGLVPVDDKTSCFPGHILQTGLFQSMAPEQKLDLRREALGQRGDVDWLYRGMLAALSGGISLRQHRERIRRLL